DGVAGRQQRACPVLAVEPELERLLACHEAAALPLGSLGLLAGLCQPVLDVGEGAAGRLVLGVEALLPRVETGDLGLQGGEGALGPLGALECLLPGAGEPADLLGCRCRAALERVDLSVQPGQPLAAVGGRAEQAGNPAVLLGVARLGLLASPDR